MDLASLISERCRNRALGLMGMFASCVNLQLAQHVASKGILLWQHPLDSQEDQIGGLAFQPLAEAFDLLTMVSVVPCVVTVFEFATGHLHLFGVDNDDKLTRVDVRGVLWAVFPHQYHCNFASQPTLGAIGRIDDVPLLFDLTRLGNRCFLLSNHDNS